MTTPNEESPVLLTVDEVCALLHFSRPVVYGLINSGELRSFKVGRSRRIPAVALPEFVEGRLDPDGHYGA
jgi:excisionase family DNA binding protein